MAILKDELICRNGNFAFNIGGDRPDVLFFRSTADDVRLNYPSASIQLNKDECVKLATKLLSAAACFKDGGL